MTSVRILLGIATASLLADAAGLPPSGTLKFQHSQSSLLTESNRRLTVDVWLPVGSNDNPFPLLIFSPGYGNKPSQYLSQLEDLASHGFAIGAIEHAPDRLDSFEARARLWATDILAVKRSILGSVVGKAIDSRRVGAFGHSLGGRAAAGACLLDPAILACMNQDGRIDDVQLLRPYWPIPGRDFAGAFAMLDWFDPGFTHEDFRGMGKTPEQYAHSRLDPTPSAAVSYKAAQRGAVRMTILSPGMRHTAFTDDLWSSASTEAERGRFAEYLKQVRTATRLFFERSLNGDYRELCALRIPQIHIVCFQSPAR